MSDNQDAYPDVYHLTLDIIFTQSFFFSPIFNFPRLIYLEPNIDIAEFTFGLKLDIAKFWDYTSSDQTKRNDALCVSLLASRSALEITSELVMRFQECYKTLVNCIYNIDNFTTDTAKYFESCSQSSKTTITMYSLTNDEWNFAFRGDADDEVLRADIGTGSICKPGNSLNWYPIIPSGDIKSSFIFNLIDYVATAMEQNGLKSGDLQLFQQ